MKMNQLSRHIILKLRWYVCQQNWVRLTDYGTQYTKHETRRSGWRAQHAVARIAARCDWVIVFVAMHSTRNQQGQQRNEPFRQNWFTSMRCVCQADYVGAYKTTIIYACAWVRNEDYMCCASANWVREPGSRARVCLTDDAWTVAMVSGIYTDTRGDGNAKQLKIWPICSRSIMNKSLRSRECMKSIIHIADTVIWHVFTKTSSKRRNIRARNYYSGNYLNPMLRLESMCKFAKLLRTMARGLLYN